MCKFCKQKTKTWSKDNSPIKCAFSQMDMNGKQRFSSDNWNCWAMDFFRGLAEKNAIWSDDNYWWLIAYEWQFYYLWWYKSRWATDEFLEINSREDITLEDAYNLIDNLIKE